MYLHLTQTCDIQSVTGQSRAVYESQEDGRLIPTGKTEKFTEEVIVELGMKMT